MSDEGGLILARHDDASEGGFAVGHRLHGHVVGVIIPCGACPGVGDREGGVAGGVEGDGGREGAQVAPRARVQAQLDAAALEEEAEEEEQREDGQDNHAHHRGDEVEHRHLTPWRAHRISRADAVVIPAQA